MRDTYHPPTASGSTEGTILNGLQFGYGGRGGIGEPDGRGISEKGLDEGFESDD